MGRSCSKSTAGKQAHLSGHLYATWCGPCNLLELITFSNKKAGEIYNDSFINVSLNGEGREGALLAAKYKIKGYPTLIYLDKNGNPILYKEGFVKPVDFIKIGKAVVEKIIKVSSGSKLLSN